MLKLFFPDGEFLRLPLLISASDSLIAIRFPRVCVCVCVCVIRFSYFHMSAFFMGPYRLVIRYYDLSGVNL